MHKVYINITCALAVICTLLNIDQPPQVLENEMKDSSLTDADSDKLTLGAGDYEKSSDGCKC